jgi:Fic family protein
MTTSKIDADETNEIIRLYVDEKLSVRTIATRFDRSYSRIYSLLQSRVVMRKRPGRGPRTTMESVKIAEAMRQLIVTGQWQPNRKILSQQDLAKIFDARQQTIREAIAHLRQRGYLMTLPSKGTYVRTPQHWESGA